MVLLDMYQFICIIITKLIQCFFVVCVIDLVVFLQSLFQDLILLPYAIEIEF